MIIAIPEVLGELHPGFTRITLSGGPLDGKVIDLKDDQVIEVLLINYGGGILEYRFDVG